MLSTQLEEQVRSLHLSPCACVEPPESAAQGACTIVTFNEELAVLHFQRSMYTKQIKELKLKLAVRACSVPAACDAYKPRYFVLLAQQVQARANGQPASPSLSPQHFHDQVPAHMLRAAELELQRLQAENDRKTRQVQEGTLSCGWLVESMHTHLLAADPISTPTQTAGCLLAADCRVASQAGRSRVKSIAHVRCDWWLEVVGF